MSLVWIRWPARKGCSIERIDAGHEVGGDVLEGEAEREAEDAGAGEQRGDRLLQPEDAQRDEEAGGEQGQEDRLAEQPRHLLAVGDPMQQALQEAPHQLGEQPEADQHRHRHREVGQQQDEIRTHPITFADSRSQAFSIPMSGVNFLQLVGQGPLGLVSAPRGFRLSQTGR